MTIYADTLAFIGGKMGPPEFTSEIFSRLRASGVRLIQWGGPHPMPPNGWVDLIAEVSAAECEFGSYPELFCLVRSGEDLDDLEHDHLVHVVMTVQNPYCIGNNWERLINLWICGVRVIQLAYWDERDALYASGFYSGVDRGLTEMGRAYLDKIADCDFILDLSHLGPRSGIEAAEVYGGQVMISHTGSREVYDYPRNATDDVILLVGERNGIVGVYMMTFFLDGEDNGVEPWLRHIEHILGLVGEDRVAIGSDAPVTGFPDIKVAEADFPKLTTSLSRGKEIKPEWAPRWPAFIPAFDNTDRFQIMEALLESRFGGKIARKIMGENALAFYRRAIP